MSRIPLRALVLFTALATLGFTAQACDDGGDDDGTTTGGNNDPGNTDSGGADGGVTDGADTTGSDNPNITGPTSQCIYGYGNAEVAIDFGVACESNDDCAHETCMMPGDEGNITNDVFGFCSRGCDCDDSDDAKLPSENPDYHCIYPGGCWVGQSEGAWRHAAKRCSTLDDCLAIDDRYTDCQTTNQLTVVEDTCGSLKKVCQAHAE